MSPLFLLKRPGAFLPIAMSVLALICVLFYIAIYGTTAQSDEGAIAHIWQLLIIMQIPIILYFAAKWLPSSPRQARAILVLQIGALLTAMLPVFLLHW